MSLPPAAKLDIGWSTNALGFINHRNLPERNARRFKPTFPGYLGQLQPEVARRDAKFRNARPRPATAGRSMFHPPSDRIPSPSPLAHTRNLSDLEYKNHYLHRTTDSPPSGNIQSLSQRVDHYNFNTLAVANPAPDRDASGMTAQPSRQLPHSEPAVDVMERSPGPPRTTAPRPSRAPRNVRWVQPAMQRDVPYGRASSSPAPSRPDSAQANDVFTSNTNIGSCQVCFEEFTTHTKLKRTVASDCAHEISLICRPCLQTYISAQASSKA